MDRETYRAHFPFTQEASSYVKESNYSLEAVVIKPAYERVRIQAKKQLLNVISGNEEPVEKLPDPSMELLSYPASRIMVAAIGDQYLIRRFALYVSKWAYQRLKAAGEDVLMDVSSDFALSVRGSSTFKDKKFELHFTDFLRYSAILRNPDWKLINQSVIKGKVYITHEKCARLLEEAIRERVQSGLNQKVPEGISRALEPYLIEIRAELDKLKAERNIAADGEVSEEAFPPCMRQMLSDLQKGVNLPHTARFALTSFLANIGLDKGQIMELYRVAPDFREDMTRYQVEHITGGSGTEYTAPSCKTMMTYGNCAGKNRYCEYCTHPLSYYRKAKARNARKPKPVGQPPVAADGKGKAEDSQGT
jgi:DNA primase large subunit